MHSDSQTLWSDHIALLEDIFHDTVGRPQPQPLFPQLAYSPFL